MHTHNGYKLCILGLFCLIISACNPATEVKELIFGEDEKIPENNIEIISITVSGTTDENATVWMQGGNSDSDGLVDTNYSLEQFSGPQSHQVNESTQFILSETLSAQDPAGNRRDYGLDIQVRR